MNKIFLLFSLLFLSIAGLTQAPEILKIRKYRTEHEKDILPEFLSFLSIPNIATDEINIRRNADTVAQMMRVRGISQVQLLQADDLAAPPVVYGEVITPGAKRTIVFYAHYDGQPVNPAQWAQGLSPFVPVFFNGRIDQDASKILFPQPLFDPSWRIYARGASDDKAGVMAILNAYSAIMGNGDKPTCNLKFFFEGEEEADSPHIADILQKYAGLLRADLWIICDGPVHQSGKKQIVFGVRGETGVDISVYGANRPLHSGHYGNWAPNPAMQLAKLLASMKDDKGRVTVKGFYDDVLPLTAVEKKTLAELPPVDDYLKNELGIRQQEIPDKNLYESLLMPSLNIRGMQSANIGDKASNIIPAIATASIDLRLVPGNDGQRQQQKLVDHIKGQGFYITDKEPTSEERKQYSKIAKVTKRPGYNAMRTAMDNIFAKGVIDAVRSTTSDQVVLLPTMGGSLPLVFLEKYLAAKIIVLPIANYDNNQHAENENLRLQNFWDGIETLASVMIMK